MIELRIALREDLPTPPAEVREESYWLNRGWKKIGELATGQLVLDCHMPGPGQVVARGPWRYERCPPWVRRAIVVEHRWSGE